MDETKFKHTMETKLKRIAILSEQDCNMEFKWLMPHFSYENLKCCFQELDGKKAVGIDGKTKEEYARNLDENIRELIRKMKSFQYRPEPVLKVLIPKSNGKFRELGISNIEDKIIQLMFSKIMSAIYEPVFCNCSYGFRSNKSAHMAIRDVTQYLKSNNVKVVIDVDLENFFGTIQHDKLLEMLSLKIKDKTFIRYIARMLKAKIHDGAKVKRTYAGLAQGSILSPVLSNIYAHYVIDLWVVKRVPKHITGKIGIFRYADDIVTCNTDTRDVRKFLMSLEKRLLKFGLKLNKEKTRTVRFNRYTCERGIKQETFDFLGFTFYLSKARTGNFTIIKVKTSKKTLREKLHNVKEWVKGSRFKGTMKDIWLKFCRKIQGHIVYFGVTNNGRSVGTFLHKARKIFFKWMNRRSQKRSCNWVQFSQFEKQYPMPKVKIFHSTY